MKKKIVLAAYCLLLVCTVSFAWILGGDPHTVPYVLLDYKEKGNLTVSDVEAISADVFFANVTDDSETGDEDVQYVPAEEFVIDSNSFVPNTIVPFKICIKNKGSQAVFMNLSMIGIKVSDPAFLDVVFVSISGGKGYTDESLPTIYTRLSEASRAGEEGNYTYNLPLYNGTLFIPGNDTGADTYVSELEGYLYFDRNADARYQNMSLDISAFRLEQ